MRESVLEKDYAQVVVVVAEASSEYSRHRSVSQSSFRFNQIALKILYRHIGKRLKVLTTVSIAWVASICVELHI